MPNANLINRFVGANTPAQGANVVPSITLVATTEQLFAAQAGGTAIIAPFPPAQLLGATTAPSFQSGFDGAVLKVRATFKATTAGTSTIIMNMYCNQVGTTITNGNKIASVTSQSLATASAGGFLEAVVFWDSLGKILVGYQSGIFGSGTLVAGAALTNAAVSIPALANLNFSMTATNGSSVVGNIVALTEFAIEAV